MDGDRMERGDPGTPGRSKRRLIGFVRWLHVCLSMVSFGAMLFFAATGLTLNHVRWFRNQQTTLRHQGRVEKRWLGAPGQPEVAKLEIVEYLRQAHGIAGSLRNFDVDPAQCLVSFKGPGYAADVFIDRGTAQYEVIENRMGAMALLNDLHKGRDTGSAWSWFIDMCAVMMILISITGLALVFFVRRNRMAWLITMCGASIACYSIYRIWVW